MTPPSTCYTTSQLNKRYSRDLSMNLFGQQQSYKPLRICKLLEPLYAHVAEENAIS
ncbi:hypothetical protein RO3G_14670 [Rhizopus delemar RA 99-880]|uniref:Uncharacterized protein n=1 Tax=Rhizopus delemar (strain RA 99-880 / ATCC MYA-4621 / FGSC 9543 / NRRL 43880) TaxID=246409 RepID=I1CNC9_RHIO9|nr:hypothetical protein RO3G_14670 [Rhizopus delemar RA 99-880]|eukprot:EIE89959.1 hypothetical protein RO3G_14670 [Rhizopus delemar RA 99-880]